MPAFPKPLLCKKEEVRKKEKEETMEVNNGKHQKVKVKKKRESDI